MPEITNVGLNISEKSQMIWNVADMLRGPFKPHEYGLVILPMTVIKRFHDCLLPTHEQVLETYEKVKALEVRDGFLRKATKEKSRRIRLRVATNDHYLLSVFHQSGGKILCCSRFANSTFAVNGNLSDFTHFLY